MRYSKTIKKFEDLKVWSDARTLVNTIYTITSNSRFIADFSLKNQIQRSAVSVLSNIAEGFERETDKEFINFLAYSKGSAGELRSQLYIASDLGYINESEFKSISENVLEISRQISGFIKYLKSSRK